MSPLFRDRLGSLLMAGFLLVLWFQRSYTSPFGGMFPDTIMGIMTVFLVITVILSFTPWPAMLEDTGGNDHETEEGDISSGCRLRQVLVVIALLALWTGLYRSVGFAITGTLGFAAIALYLGDRSRGLRGLYRALGFGMLVSFIIYMVFAYFLLVPLPPGFLFD